MGDPGDREARRRDGPGGTGGGRAWPVLNDGHVHFHGCFDPDRFFDAAEANFERARHKHALPAESVRCLWFTESGGDRFFRAWAEGAAAPRPQRWSLRPAVDGISLLASREGGPEIVVVAGRQVRSGEGLEVLALGTEREFPDGLSFETALGRVTDSDAVAVVPWGFGKWSLGRGRLVARAVAAGAPGRVFLGDNGGRLERSFEPRLFDVARRRGIAVLPGSDPLPFPREVDRAATYGFVLTVAVDAARPGESLRGALGALRDAPPVFGRRSGILPFVRNQVAMQLRRPRGGPRP